MFPNTTISRTDLARSTRQMLERARRGQTVLVESYGEEQVAIVDALDYRLLRAVALYHARRDTPAYDAMAVPQGVSKTEVDAAIDQAQGEIQAAWDLVIPAYLDGHISLGRTSELLRITRFDLSTRFNRLALPLRLGADSIAAVRAEVETLYDLED